MSFQKILAPYNKQTLKFRQDGEFLNNTKDQPGRVQILQGVHPPGGQQEEGGLHIQKHLAVGLHAKHPPADRNHHDITRRYRHISANSWRFPDRPVPNLLGDEIFSQQGT